jgi:hypothetical protein
MKRVAIESVIEVANPAITDKMKRTVIPLGAMPGYCKSDASNDKYGLLVISRYPYDDDLYCIYILIRLIICRFERSRKLKKAC